tara:strand:+ start:82 stop:273 length:192 start_codon:yes stop_codon:yes gene_type:complete
MSKRKAIEICNNLTKTINEMAPNTHLEHKRETFEIPRAKKSVLKKIRKRLINKYKLKVNKNGI